VTEQVQRECILASIIGWPWVVEGAAASGSDDVGATRHGSHSCKPNVGESLFEGSLVISGPTVVPRPVRMK
jgi:hypothetical protein